MANESKKLAYKMAGGLASTETLQKLIKRGVSKYPKAADRLESLGADSGEVRFINLTRQHQGITFGIFHKVTRGAAQHVIDMKGQSLEWPVTTMTAKAEGRSDGEFVEGTLFFGVWKNHVVLHQRYRAGQSSSRAI